MPGYSSESQRDKPCGEATENAFRSARYRYGFWLLIAVATLMAYSPAIRGKFLWDDDANVTQPELRSVAGLARIWFEPGATEQYYPVLHTVFWLEHRWWGDEPMGYHLVTILWHVGSTALFLVILRRLRVPGAELAALIFALHPVGVESVAWIAEQKNTLSTLFYLGAALTYLRFRAEPHLRWAYVVAGVFFILALLSKSVTASLPAALLVVFWWQRGRLSWREDVRPLLPWFGAAIVVGLFSAWVERKYIGADAMSFDLSLPQRCLIAGRAVWFYLGKLAWPVDLIFIYPKWEIDPRNLSAWLWVGAVGLLFAVSWWLRGRIRTPLAVTLLFVGTLFPVLGFLNVYGSLFSYVTDHWQYLPSLSVIALAAASLARLTDHAPPPWRRLVASAVLIGLPLGLAVLTWRQCHHYRDAVALYESILEKNPQCRMAHNNLGLILARDGKTAEAIAHFEAALQLSPDYAKAHLNLADALAQSGRSGEALAHYAAAVRFEPADADAHSNFGDALAENGQLDAAIKEFRLALALAAPTAETYNSLGTALFQAHHSAEALEQYRAALRLAPDMVAARRNLANALFALGRVDEALEQYEQWLQRQPDSGDAHNLAGIALAREGRLREAQTHFERAVQLNPSDAEFRENLSRAQSQLRSP